MDFLDDVYERKDMNFLQVQMFVCVLAMVAITLAAIVHDRKQMEGELNEMNSTLESQVFFCFSFILVLFSVLTKFSFMKNNIHVTLCRSGNALKNYKRQIRNYRLHRLQKPVGQSLSSLRI